MRIVALLSWFDEPLPALAACLTTLRSRAGVDHVVALDGRYSLYPAEYDVSPREQVYAIQAACAQLDMGCTVRVPDRPWSGEAQKRTALFAFGLEETEPGDWFCVMDADQVVMTAPADLHDRLRDAEEDVAEVTFNDDVIREINPPGFPSKWGVRILFRAQAIVVGPSHWMYRDASGAVLWGGGPGENVPGLDLAGDFLVDHRPQVRETSRLLAKQQYYARRDETGVELGDCVECGARATRRIHGNWRLAMGEVVGEILELCATCADARRAMDARRLRAMGRDPTKLRDKGERYGFPPAARRRRVRE